MTAGPLRGLISQVQRFSIHDGPGIRTTVFLKGCPLRCFWCHNPETWLLQPEVQLFAERCIGCRACLERCPHGAQVEVAGRRQFRRELCQACGRCTDTCYAEALALVGRWWTPEELLAELVRDRAFYEASGGGVTLSGGEPLLQSAFSRRVLELCKEEGLHTAIETAALGPWRDLAAFFPHLDLAMVDLKHLDEAAHRRATGASNRLILANLRRLGGTAVPLIVRTPVVPGVNDTAGAIGAIAAFVSGLPNLLYYELLPFHRLAEGKYCSLGLDFRAATLEPPEKEALQLLAAEARRQDVRDVRVA